jgi:hypothetical protein
MIKEDAPCGMAVDGMSGTGFTSTGNVAGIALGMTPIDSEKKKKKKKKKDLNVTENIISLIEKDLEEGSFKDPFIFKSENPHPTMATKLKTEDPIKTPVGKPSFLKELGQLRVKRVEGDEKDSTVTEAILKDIKDRAVIILPPVVENSTTLAPVPPPMYTPKFNLANYVGTADQSLRMNRFPGSIKGPRSRAKLAAILGGLGGEKYVP